VKLTKNFHYLNAQLKMYLYIASLPTNTGVDVPIAMHSLKNETDVIMSNASAEQTFAMSVQQRTRVQLRISRTRTANPGVGVSCLMYLKKSHRYSSSLWTRGFIFHRAVPVEARVSGYSMCFITGIGIPMATCLSGCWMHGAVCSAIIVGVALVVCGRWMLISRIPLCIVFCPVVVGRLRIKMTSTVICSTIANREQQV
jgi:hypothetical protein